MPESQDHALHSMLLDGDKMAVWPRAPEWQIWLAMFMSLLLAIIWILLCVRSAHSVDHKGCLVLAVIFNSIVVPLLFLGSCLCQRSEVMMMFENNFGANVKLLRPRLAKVVDVGIRVLPAYVLMMVALCLAAALSLTLPFPAGFLTFLISSPWCSQAWFFGSLALATITHTVFTGANLLKVHVLISEAYRPIIDFIDQTERQVQWENLASRVHEIEIHSARLLCIGHAGMCYAVSISCGACIIFASPVGVLLLPWHSPAQPALAAYFLLGLLHLFGPLLLLAQNTSEVLDVAAEAKSVLAAALRYPSQLMDDTEEHGTEQRHGSLRRRQGSTPTFARTELDMDAPGGRRSGFMSSEEKLEYNHFMNYILLSPIGTEICGVKITKQFVFSTIIKLAVGLPTAVGVLKKLLHKEDPCA